MSVGNAHGTPLRFQQDSTWADGPDDFNAKQQEGGVFGHQPAVSIHNCIDAQSSTEDSVEPSGKADQGKVVVEASKRGRE